MDFDDIPSLINLFTILTRSTRGSVTTSCVYMCVCDGWQDTVSENNVSDKSMCDNSKVVDRLRMEQSWIRRKDDFPYWCK